MRDRSQVMTERSAPDARLRSSAAVHLGARPLRDNNPVYMPCGGKNWYVPVCGFIVLVP